MVEPTRALHEGADCPTCGAPLEVVRVDAGVGGVTVEGEVRFPALYRCAAEPPHCWGDYVRPHAAAGKRLGFELRPRRCDHDERYADDADGSRSTAGAR